MEKTIRLERELAYTGTILKVYRKRMIISTTTGRQQCFR